MLPFADSKSVGAMTKQLGTTLYSMKTATAVVEKLEEMRQAEIANGSVADRLLVSSMQLATTEEEGVDDSSDDGKSAEGKDSDGDEEEVVEVRLGGDV